MTIGKLQKLSSLCYFLISEQNKIDKYYIINTNKYYIIILQIYTFFAEAK